MFRVFFPHATRTVHGLTARYFSTRTPVLGHHAGERHRDDEPTLAHIGKHHEGEDSWMSIEEVEGERHEDPSHYSNRQYRTSGDMKDMQDDILKLFQRTAALAEYIDKAVMETRDAHNIFENRVEDLENDSLEQSEAVGALHQNLMEIWNQTSQLGHKVHDAKKRIRWVVREELQRAREDKLNTSQN